MKGKTWQEVWDVLRPLGAQSLPPADPRFADDKKYRWWDEATSAWWEVRYHVHTGRIRFARLLSNTNGEDILSQAVLDELNAAINRALKRGVGGKAPPTYTGPRTTWIDQRGWLYYGPHDKPVGLFTNIGHNLLGVVEP